MKLHVTFRDGDPVDTVSGPFAQTAVEEKYDCLYTDIYDESSGKARVHRFYFEAWASLIADGHESVVNGDGDADVDDDAAFKRWLRGVADVEPVADKTAPPTRKAQPRKKSSS